MTGARCIAAVLALIAVLPAAAQVDVPAEAPAVALGRFDDKAIAAAVRATVAEMPKLQDPALRADFGGGAAAGPDARAQIERAFKAAQVPDCHRANALKHAPPVIYVAGVPIVLGGLLSLPHLVYAASTGKCK